MRRGYCIPSPTKDMYFEAGTRHGVRKSVSLSSRQWSITPVSFPFRAARGDEAANYARPTLYMHEILRNRLLVLTDLLPPCCATTLMSLVRPEDDLSFAIALLTTTFTPP
jgi:hypothetical protein